MSDHYSIYYVEKFAEEQEAAARCGLSGKAETARRKTQRTAEPPLAGLLRTLACAFGFGGPVHAATGSGRHAK